MVFENFQAVFVPGINLISLEKIVSCSIMANSLQPHRL